MSRRTLLTDELRAEIERELASGSAVAVSAQRAGVSRRTLTSWLSEGRVARRQLAAPDPEPELSLDEHLDQAEPVLVAVILEAARRGNWRAAAWLLERGPTSRRWMRPPQRVKDEPPAA
jgi:hypothetical protein